MARSERQSTGSKGSRPTAKRQSRPRINKWLVLSIVVIVAGITAATAIVVTAISASRTSVPPRATISAPASSVAYGTVWVKTGGHGRLSSFCSGPRLHTWIGTTGGIFNGWEIDGQSCEDGNYYFALIPPNSNSQVVSVGARVIAKDKTHPTQTINIQAVDYPTLSLNVDTVHDEIMSITAEGTS